MMRAGFLIAALSIGTATPALAQRADWRTVGQYGSGASLSLMMIDAGSLRQTPAGLREITVTSFFGEQKHFSGGEPFDSVHISYRLDCKANTAQTFQSVAYDVEKPILTSDTVTEMKPYAPGTILETIAPAVCSGDFSKFPRIGAATPHLEGKANFGR